LLGFGEGLKGLVDEKNPIERKLSLQWSV